MNQELGVERVLDIEPSAENPRNSEGSIIEQGLPEEMKGRIRACIDKNRTYLI